ncbi:MAG TPA: hypothetical protein VG939_09440 [Caulobacteraceae bacterium]|nr:hypothetical protein [Caulobacteraceae bacterium]
MSAAARKPAEPSVTADFVAHGYHVFAGVDPKAAAALLDKLKATRAWDESLFLSEAEFDADPQYVGVNPKPGRNLLERFEPDLAFVEQDAGIVAGLTEILGDGYELMNRKVVCGVPARSVPAWLKARITDNPVNNLGAYVRPQYRDVTYFYGIDFHQDLIDFKDRDADFITLYVYLHPVTRHDAPLFLLEDSHRLGATLFPHDLTKAGDGWLYRDGRGGEVMCPQKLLLGEAGYAAMWHACTLHGTQPDAADNERLSLRYLYARRPGAKAGMDEVNASLDGPISLSTTREDLDASGRAQVKKNSVNKA